ncbi:DUF3299 domain-containing protein [Mesorhizobium japonicum]|uniref:Mlr0556 protein n=1 Tax=Mesorhizobium japonicum (strain LMG 29417 / CECT 9101 / MAFF 303099) TaxID=266835 RepID=Q98MJ4_RHILO|nr:DUF3299 domain-containing protein [Mesorhizobium japonicum]BAB48119.1 mlr0556 [Mesorhizobium japonicum MAFF 303099]
MNHFTSITGLAAALSLCAAGASAETMHIFWKDLRPATQLAGYALPVDRDGDLVYQFLLVPWTGACSHMPTPPPNQIVLVTPAHPYKMSQAYQSVAVTGALKPDIEKSQLFILDGVSVIQSGYSVRKADVIGVDTVPDTVTLPVNSPWSFLNKKKN